MITIIIINLQMIVHIIAFKEIIGLDSRLDNDQLPVPQCFLIIIMISIQTQPKFKYFC